MFHSTGCPANSSVFSPSVFGHWSAECHVTVLKFPHWPLLFQNELMQPVSIPSVVAFTGSVANLAPFLRTFQSPPLATLFKKAPSDTSSGFLTNRSYFTYRGKFPVQIKAWNWLTLGRLWIHCNDITNMLISILLLHNLVELRLRETILTLANQSHCKCQQLSAYKNTLFWKGCTENISSSMTAVSVCGTTDEVQRRCG